MFLLPIFLGTAQQRSGNHWREILKNTSFLPSDKIISFRAGLKVSEAIMGAGVNGVNLTTAKEIFRHMQYQMHKMDLHNYYLIVMQHSQISRELS